MSEAREMGTNGTAAQVRINGFWVSSGSQLNSEEVLPGSAVAGAFCPLPKGLLGGEIGFVTATNTGHEK